MSHVKKGRPLKFVASKRNEFLVHIREGKTIEEAAKLVDTPARTILTRIARYPSFKAKYERAREKSMTIIEERMFRMARGDKDVKGHFVPMFGVLKAYKGDRWREKAQVDLSNKDGTLKQTINNFVSADVIDGPPKNDSEHVH